MNRHQEDKLEGKNDVAADTVPTSAATVPAETQAAVKLQSEVNVENVLKPLRGWNEIAQRAAAGDNSKCSYLKTGTAYTSTDGKIYIKFTNEFAKSIVDTDQMRDNIRAAINISTQRSISDNELVIGVIQGNENISDLDEFDLDEF